MNPITALMLSRAVEADRRRELAARLHRLPKAEPADGGDRRGPRWLLRLPLRLALSRA